MSLDSHSPQVSTAPPSRGDRAPDFARIMAEAVVIRANALIHAALKSGKITLTNPGHTVQNVTQQVVAERTAQKAKPRSYVPRMDLVNDPKCNVYVAFVELPGVKDTDLELKVDDNLLIISGVRRWRLKYPDDVSPEGLSNFMPIHELRYGHFYRTIPLPPGTKRTDLIACMENGTLMITWPKQSDPSDLTQADAATPLRPHDSAPASHHVEAKD